MQEQAAALADAIEAALPAWIEACVARVVTASGGSMDAALTTVARETGKLAAVEVVPELRDLLAADIDSQRSNPLALLREAALYPTALLKATGYPPVERDENQVKLFPGDIYDLAPASFADLGPEVAGAGLAWGAAKAWTHLQRHPKPIPADGEAG